MQNRVLAAVLATAFATAGPAAADPTVMLGFTMKFGGGVGAGGNFGLTAKVLSNDERHKAVVGLGLSWYPGQDRPFGADLSGGYIFDDAALTFGYDFIGAAPALGLGFVNSKNPAPSAPPPPPPADDPS